MAFISRVLYFLFIFAVLGGLLYLTVFVIRRTIQGIATATVLELKEFGIWIRSLFPKRPKKRKK